MTKHTKGPWVTKAQSDANHYFTTQPNGHWLASIQFNGGLLTAEQEANTRLIDAATELFEALQPFVLANSSEEFVTLVVRSSDITKARAAIAKVTGAA